MNFHLTVKQPPKIIPKTKVYSAKPHWKETLQLLLINFQQSHSMIWKAIFGKLKVNLLTVTNH